MSSSSNCCSGVHRCRALQDKFAVVVACTLGFPEFLGFRVRVFLKVGASFRVGACGMHGTDEVWVARVEETAIALREFGHGGRVGLGLGLVKLGWWWRSHSRQDTVALPASRIRCKNWTNSAKQSGLFSSNHSVSITECLVFLNSTRASENVANSASRSFTASIFPSTHWELDSSFSVEVFEK